MRDAYIDIYANNTMIYSNATENIKELARIASAFSIRDQKDFLYINRLSLRAGMHYELC